VTVLILLYTKQAEVTQKWLCCF